MRKLIDNLTGLDRIRRNGAAHIQDENSPYHEVSLKGWNRYCDEMSKAMGMSYKKGFLHGVSAMAAAGIGMIVMAAVRKWREKRGADDADPE